MSRFQSLPASNLLLSQLVLQNVGGGSKKRRSEAGWMPERTGKFSVGVGRRHLVTMCKA